MNGSTPPSVSVPAGPRPDGGYDIGDELAVAALVLARRFNGGATLWSVAPGRDDHARHVAVEFVHPVIVGSPSLPGLAITGTDLVDQCRLNIRIGDVLLLIGEADCVPLAAIAARARAWGATTVWLCIGDRPEPGAADAVVSGAREPDVIRSYHLLWELCHVCLQHPEVLSVAETQTSDTCAVCSDGANLAEVTSTGEHPMVRLRTSCGPAQAFDLLGDVEVGELVVVHAATVIGRHL